MKIFIRQYYILFLVVPTIIMCSLCGCRGKDSASSANNGAIYTTGESADDAGPDSASDPATHKTLSLAGQISFNNNMDSVADSSISSSFTDTVVTDNTSDTSDVSRYQDAADGTIAWDSASHIKEGPMANETGADVNGTDTTVISIEEASAAPSSDETAPSVQRYGYITGSDVKIRSTPDTDSDNILASLGKGDNIGCVSEADGWVQVLYEGRTAYVYSTYVSYEPIDEETYTVPYVGDYDDGVKIGLLSSWKYAGESIINTGYATYYKASDNRKNIIICVNAGHGTSGVGGRKTQCHPDGSPKVTGGTTKEGATKAIAISTGMDFDDGTPESKVTLAMAKVLKAKLLDSGYDVLMIRETDDVQLDNIARTVIANNTSHCHIALHWDSSSKDKGAYYMSVPSVSSYRNMEPVASNWEKHEKLGKSLISGLRDAGVKIYSSGSIEMDLTQTSYSTIPSIDIELGDAASSHSDSALDQLGDGLLKGINIFFHQ